MHRSFLLDQAEGRLHFSKATHRRTQGPSQSPTETDLQQCAQVAIVILCWRLVCRSGGLGDSCHGLGCRSGGLGCRHGGLGGSEERRTLPQHRLGLAVTGRRPAARGVKGRVGILAARRCAAAQHPFPAGWAQGGAHKADVPDALVVWNGKTRKGPAAQRQRGSFNAASSRS